MPIKVVTRRVGDDTGKRGATLRELHHLENVMCSTRSPKIAGCAELLAVMTLRDAVDDPDVDVEALAAELAATCLAIVPCAFEFGDKKLAPLARLYEGARKSLPER